MTYGITMLTDGRTVRPLLDLAAPPGRPGVRRVPGGPPGPLADLLAPPALSPSDARRRVGG